MGNRQAASVSDMEQYPEEIIVAVVQLVELRTEKAV